MAPPIQPRKLFRVKSVPVISPGRYVSMSGKEFDATEERLRELFGGYDADKLHQAQMKLGHGDDGSVGTPGFVEKARYSDGYGQVDLITDEAGVKSILRTGTHPRRSIETILLNGKLYLGDVAFMGNQRPAVKSLPHIQPSQVEEVSEAEVMAFAERIDWEATSEIPTGLLLAEESHTSTQEEPMADNDALKLAEEKHALEIKLAEVEREKERALAELKEKSDREAVLLAERKLAEANADALKFAESVKQQTGTVDTNRVADILAHAAVNCPAMEGQNFGEVLKGILKQLPKLPPENVQLGDKPEVEPDEIKTGKQAVAYLEAKRPSALKLAEGFAGTADEKDKYLIALAENVRDEEGSN